MAIPSIGDIKTGGGLKPKGIAQYPAAQTTAAFGLGTIVPTSGASFANTYSTALVQAEAQGVRVGMAGGLTPTTTVGFLIPVGEAVVLHGDLSAYRFINAAAGAILNVVYLG